MLNLCCHSQAGEGKDTNLNRALVEGGIARLALGYEDKVLYGDNLEALHRIFRILTAHGKVDSETRSELISLARDIPGMCTAGQS